MVSDCLMISFVCKSHEGRLHGSERGRVHAYAGGPPSLMLPLGAFGLLVFAGWLNLGAYIDAVT